MHYKWYKTEAHPSAQGSSLIDAAMTTPARNLYETNIFNIANIYFISSCYVEADISIIYTRVNLMISSSSGYKY